jgi:rfaE bifunctional protein nucleotidyltransferase chain/domain
MFSHKIIEFGQAGAVLDSLRAEGKKIVQCHGTFDLIHPGHIYHLEEARGYGDILVVTVTAEKFVNKGPGRPYFNDKLRARSLAALGCIDYVVVVPHPAAVEAILCVRPHVYCKGREYADAENDVTGNIREDVAAVEKIGGEVHYLGSVVFSSSKLINSHFDHVPVEVKKICQELAKSHPPGTIKEAVESFSNLRVLVVGDIIFDRYSYLRVQGLTSKNRILSGRYLYEDTQPGGALAVFNHIKQFTPHVRLASLMGSEPWSLDLLRRSVSPEQDAVVKDEEFTTIIKQRFVESAGVDKELGKLFSVNFIDAEPPGARLRDQLIENVVRALPEVDLVVVADFGHGVLSDLLRECVQSKAPFLALNCQTNSNNHGFNIISHQYQRADCFSLDEQELLLSAARKDVDYTLEMESLRRKLQASSAWLTRGGTETIGVAEGRKPFVCLPLETAIKDTVGAGDAFFSVAALAAAKKLPIDLTTFLGQLAGGQAVKIIGNSEPISKATLLKSAMSLTSF